MHEAFQSSCYIALQSSETNKVRMGGPGGAQGPAAKGQREKENLSSQVRSVHHGMELDTKHAATAMSCVFLACFGVLFVCCSQLSSTESNRGGQCSCLVALVRYLTEMEQRLRSS